jgi:hypothetical protein
MPRRASRSCPRSFHAMAGAALAIAVLLLPGALLAESAQGTEKWYLERGRPKIARR